jgi:enoyl-[acyl-carrier protein] reductase / trans-2-enoyl-CoA reductase (NAD+)
MKTEIKTKKTVLPKIRGHVCLTAHPKGCRQNVKNQIKEVKSKKFISSVKNVLVIGSSTGYGLASTITALFGLKADVLGICYEKPAERDRTASAGYYNTVSLHKFADEAGLKIKTINGDAFSNQIKQKAAEELKNNYGKLDLIIYSIAAPRRKDPFSDTVYSSVIKPIGSRYQTKSIDLINDSIINLNVEPATIMEIHETVKVMGGGDWELWLNSLIDKDLINNGCRTLAYSYIGSSVTENIYRTGTIGAAKEDLEKTALYLNEKLKKSVNGNAWVCVNKALVTQASSAIPSIPLYLSILFDILKYRDESCIEQIIRLFSKYLDSGKKLITDNENRIRLDDIELENSVQNEIIKRWTKINTKNIYKYADPDKYRNEFLKLFGFNLESIDYTKPVDVDLTL